jgi:ATP:corrinoid adenosyltransferase
MKQRLVVMNGQCSMQQEDQGKWRNVKVEKAKGVKPGIYNIYTANKADKTTEHLGLILFADKTTVYQQVGKGQYITHDRADFAKLPESGEMKSISYSADGKAVVSEVALGQKQSRKI